MPSRPRMSFGQTRSTSWQSWSSARRRRGPRMTRSRLFKSVGTGVQDIALAAKIYQRATERGLGLPLHGFPIVKKG